MEAPFARRQPAKWKKRCRVFLIITAESLPSACCVALLMGLQDTAERLYSQVRAALRKDGHFLSLCDSLHTLNRIRQHRHLLGIANDDGLRLLVVEAYRNAVDKLPQLAHTNQDEHAAIIQGLKLLSMLADSAEQPFEDETFRSYLNDLLMDQGLPLNWKGSALPYPPGSATGQSRKLPSALGLIFAVHRSKCCKPRCICKVFLRFRAMHSCMKMSCCRN